MSLPPFAGQLGCVGQRSWSGLVQGQVSDYGGILTGMAINELTTDTLDLATTGNGVALVEWRAGDNDHGQLIAPVFEAASRRHPDVRFAIVDARAQPQLSADAGIVSLPTLMAFHDGVRVFTMPGALSPPILDRLIQAIRDLDMDDVRRHGPPPSNRILTVNSCGVHSRPR